MYTHPYFPPQRKAYNNLPTPKSNHYKDEIYVCIHTHISHHKEKLKRGNTGKIMSYDSLHITVISSTRHSGASSSSLSDGMPEKRHFLQSANLMRAWEGKGKLADGEGELTRLSQKRGGKQNKRER